MTLLGESRGTNRERDTCHFSVAVLGNRWRRNDFSFRRIRRPKGATGTEHFGLESRDNSGWLVYGGLFGAIAGLFAYPFLVSEQ
jgi:hypothetical protein